MSAIEKLHAMLLAITGSAGTSEMPAEALDAYLAQCAELAADALRNQPE
jgi:hypothetical protein